jgi:hypothetical protein
VYGTAADGADELALPFDLRELCHFTCAHGCPLRNLYAAAPDLYAGCTRGDQIGCVHVVVARRWAFGSARSSERRAIATTVMDRMAARVAARRLDARLAAGEDALSDVVLACRARRLVSGRSRRSLARGLERAWSLPRGHAVLSAAVAVDERAVEVARPALQQLAWALRSRAEVEPRGVAIARILLTEPCSALYRPAYRDELYELARAALFALRSGGDASTAPVRR